MSVPDDYVLKLDQQCDPLLWTKRFTRKTVTQEYQAMDELSLWRKARNIPRPTVPRKPVLKRSY